MNIFSLVAKFYDKIVPKSNIENVLEMLPLDKNSLIMDLGGGTGRIALSLSNYTNECLVLDSSLNMLEQAKKKSKKLLLINGDGCLLPLKDNSMNQIILNNTLHHVDKHSYLLAEMYRIMKKEGILIIRDLNPAKWRNRIIIFLESLFFRCTFFKIDELDKLLKEKKFSTSSFEDSEGSYIMIGIK